MNLKKYFKKGKEFSKLANSTAPKFKHRCGNIFHVINKWVFYFLYFDLVQNFLVKLNKYVDEHVIITSLFGFCGQYFKLLEDFFVNFFEGNFQEETEDVESILQKVNLIV